MVFKKKKFFVLTNGFSFIRAVSLKRGVFFKWRVSFQKIGFLSKGWLSFFQNGVFIQRFVCLNGFFSNVCYFHIGFSQSFFQMIFCSEFFFFFFQSFFFPLFFS